MLPATFTDITRYLSKPRNGRITTGTNQSADRYPNPNRRSTNVTPCQCPSLTNKDVLSHEERRASQLPQDKRNYIQRKFCKTSLRVSRNGEVSCERHLFSGMLPASFVEHSESVMRSLHIRTVSEPSGEHWLSAPAAEMCVSLAGSQIVIAMVHLR